MPFKRHLLASAGGALALAAAAPSAWAQALVPPADSGGAVEQVIVTAPRQEERAREVQFAAPNLINVQPAETIAKYPDFNAAEALGRIPGVSLSSDTGEGRFVNIRGLDANLNGATYGGVVLLNTNPGGTAAGGGGRAVEFDTIPTGAIDGIIVSKTLQPDHEAEGLGGSVELTPRQAANIVKPFADVTLGYGFEPLHDHGGPFNAEVALGARFGFANGRPVVEGAGAPASAPGGWISNPTPFSFVLTYSRRDDRRGIDDLEQGYINDPAVPANASGGFDLRRYDYHRRRFGYGGEFDFTPNENHRYYVRADVAGYTESVHKNFLLFTGVDSTFGDTGAVAVDPADPRGLLATTRPVVSLTDEQETHRNQVYVAGGQDEFGRVVLDYHVAYSRATFNVGRNIGAQFRGPTVPFTYDNASDVDYPKFGFPSGFNVNDATQYKLNRITDSLTADRDEERTYAANLLFPGKLFSDDDRIKVGVQARIRDKVVDPTNRLSFGDLPPLLLSDASTAANDFYDGRYSNGPFINLYTVRGLAGGAQGVTDPGFTPDLTGYSRSDENIYAGYAQYDAKVGKFGALVGVRIERTEAQYQVHEDLIDAAGDETFPLNVRKTDYTNAFPTLQLRYEVTPKLLARLSVSTGIGRPGFNQVAASTSVDASNADLVLISRGNPDLKPTYGTNFDLDLEYYLPLGGILQAGIFDKEFDDYIVQRIQNRITTDPLAPGQLATVTTYLNVPAAYARGVEAAYNQRFDFLPGALKGLGIEANVTYVDSQILEYTAAQTGTRDEYGLLPGTSRLTWNVAGFYEAYGLQTRLAAQYVGPSLFGLGGAKALDTIQDERLTLDFTSSYLIGRGVSVYFNARNLLNTPLRYYQGVTSLPIQREFYDVTYEGGLRFRF